MNKDLREIHDYLNIHNWREFDRAKSARYRYCDCGRLQYKSTSSWYDSDFYRTDPKKYYVMSKGERRDIMNGAKAARIILANLPLYNII